MPRILELKEINNEVWARLDTPCLSGFYIWSPEEAKAAKRKAVMDFCFSLANKYIEETFLIPPEGK